MGISMIISFETPEILIEDNQITVNISVTELLTDEMKILLEHGVSFEFELYASIIAYDNDNNRELYKIRVKKYIEYDYYSNNYLLVYDNESKKYTTLEELIDETRFFRDLRFELNTSLFTKYSFFAQIYLLDNPIIENKLGMETMSLWSYHKPSVEIIFQE
jgi:hypothetical protein